jgi:hypothetical protein
MWATPLENDLFRIENVPFFAYGLNFHDVVNATSETEEVNPEIRFVVSTSGHRTYRIMFDKELSREKQVELLDSLEVHGATYERANGKDVAIDIKPQGDYLAVYDQLDEYEASELLSFETCEARAESSFDDLPE